MELMAQNSSDEGLKSNFNRYIKINRQNCYRLLRLVNNLIDITKLDAGYFKLTLVNFDIAQLVEEIVMSVELYAQNKSIALSINTRLQQKIIAIDPDKLERILLNLLSNAVKFTESGGSIEVNLWEENNNIYISIKDSGIGIPKDKLNIIFDRFSQVDRSIRRSYEGNGIGLALVKSLVELHNGSISVSSELGQGSEFIVQLPANLVAEDENQIHIKLHQNDVERINIEFSDIYSN
jgi:signal transduction histidine kinase